MFYVTRAPRGKQESREVPKKMRALASSDSGVVVAIEATPPALLHAREPSGRSSGTRCSHVLATDALRRRRDDRDGDKHHEKRGETEDDEQGAAAADDTGDDPGHEQREPAAENQGCPLELADALTVRALRCHFASETWILVSEASLDLLEDSLFVLRKRHARDVGSLLDVRIIGWAFQPSQGLP